MASRFGLYEQELAIETQTRYEGDMLMHIQWVSLKKLIVPRMAYIISRKDMCQGFCLESY